MRKRGTAELPLDIGNKRRRKKIGICENRDKGKKYGMGPQTKVNKKEGQALGLTD